MTAIKTVSFFHSAATEIELSDGHDKDREVGGGGE